MRFSRLRVPLGELRVRAGCRGCRYRVARPVIDALGDRSNSPRGEGDGVAPVPGVSDAATSREVEAFIASAEFTPVVLKRADEAAAGHQH